VTTPTAYQKPLPIRTPDNARYWDSAKEHALKLQRCGQCGKFRYPPGPFCPSCLSDDFQWQPVSGRGTIYSFIIVHQRYDPSFAEDLPYNVAVVQLEEGPRLVTNIAGIANEAISVGMPVRVTYEDVTEEFTLPKFTPA
jgi:uncharacterized OB-fold protein